MLVEDFKKDFSKLSLKSSQERLELIKSVGEECIQEAELLKLLESGKPIRAYDGFEPSGRMHIAQGLLKAINVNKLTACGVEFVFWVADWFALLNNKMGGDIEKIQTVGKYMIEVWKSAGMNMENVRFLWSSEEIIKGQNEYWALVLDIGRKNSLQRIIRCTQIMGRSETDDLTAAQIFYPVMQCADIFFLKADICQLGMDQRKVNMLAREYAEENKLTKPIVLSHHMMLGLMEGQTKMSKSIPDSAIYMEDPEEEVNRKISKAYCPPSVVVDNPIMDYYKHLIFAATNNITIKRTLQNGGDVTFSSYSDFERDYLDGKLHPKDIKTNLASMINAMLKPVRDHFEKDENAKKLLQTVKTFSITR